MRFGIYCFDADGKFMEYSDWNSPRTHDLLDENDSPITYAFDGDPEEYPELTWWVVGAKLWTAQPEGEIPKLIVAQLLLLE